MIGALPRRVLSMQRTPLPLVLLLLLLILSLSHVASAAIFTTALSTADLPANDAASATPVAGLYQACLSSTNTTAASSRTRAALAIRSFELSAVVANAITSGTYYIAGYYDAGTDAWYWNDGSTAFPTQFGSGPSASRVNGLMASNWVSGYPVVESSTNTIGALKYVVYDGAQKGWMNVDGTQTYNGVACEFTAVEATPRKGKGFPWWAILIIVLGAVVIIAVVVTVIAVCCCKKKDKYGDNDDYEEGDDNVSAQDASSRGPPRSFMSSRSIGSRESGATRSTAPRQRRAGSGKGVFLPNGTSSYSYSYSGESRSSYGSGSYSYSGSSSSGSSGGSDRSSRR